ncbi:MAG: hypothetical protein KKB31_00785 [Nanoarchaeota archaeon]|nr:hypothetical protein [Nanoarchaeota archaeon]
MKRELKTAYEIMMKPLVEDIKGNDTLQIALVFFVGTLVIIAAYSVLGLW